MTFILHPNLEKKIFVIDLPLSKVLLEKDFYYPWIFLVPRRNGISRICDLSFEDQLQFYRELDSAQKIFLKSFNPDQINLAAIGNKTPQLHIHLIARYQNDPAWPGTVWDHPVKKTASEELLKERSDLLKKSFQKEVY